MRSSNFPRAGCRISHGRRDGMRVLLDHCVPRPLGRLLVGHEVHTAREMGWDDISNGRLLAEAAKSFGAMVTVDSSLEHQQGAVPLAVILLRAQDTKIESLGVLVPGVLRLLGQNLAPRVHRVPATA